MSTLYRKYRPQTFANLTGQEHIAKTLENEVATNKVAHAYLFSGPRGVGKTTVARLLAKAVNCSNRKEKEFEPCNECQSCKEITAGRAIDVMEIDAASHTGVDNVRENIIDNARFQPTQSKYKIFIIDEAHMLSGSSFNALLKTLEEPPSHVIFILATTELHKLPATTISRCQRFQFKKIPYDLMQERLKTICAAEEVKVEKDVLGRIINKSDGCLRDAESLLGQILSLNLKKISAEDAALILPTSNVDSVLNYLEALLAGNSGLALEQLQILTGEGINLDQFAYDIIEVLRSALIGSALGKTEEASLDYDENSLKRIKKIFASVALPKLIALIDAAVKRKSEIKTSPLPQLPLELFTIEWSGAPQPLDKLGAAPSIAEGLSEEPKPSRLKTSIQNTIATITGRHPPKTTLAEIQNKWSELISAITAENHSLTFILSMCALETVDAFGLHLSFPYSLHKEKIEEIKNKTTIENCLAKTFGEPIAVVCSVAKKDAERPSDSELSNLALEFGGEVVN